MPSSRLEAALIATTEEAQRALGGAPEARVSQFPCNVGREHRRPQANDSAGGPPQRDGAAPANDVYLIEDSSGNLHISSAHFAIDRVDGQFFLIDRGSACGTIVAGRRIGGHRKSGRTDLRDGDEVVVGTSRSRYVFRFQVTQDES